MKKETLLLVLILIGSFFAFVFYFMKNKVIKGLFRPKGVQLGEFDYRSKSYTNEKYKDPLTLDNIASTLDGAGKQWDSLKGSWS